MHTEKGNLMGKRKTEKRRKSQRNYVVERRIISRGVPRDVQEKKEELQTPKQIQRQHIENRSKKAK